MNDTLTTRVEIIEAWIGMRSDWDAELLKRIEEVVNRPVKVQADVHEGIEPDQGLKLIVRVSELGSSRIVPVKFHQATLGRVHDMGKWIASTIEDFTGAEWRPTR